MGLSNLGKIDVRHRVLILGTTILWLVAGCSVKESGGVVRMVEEWDFTHKGTGPVVQWGGDGWHTSNGEQFTVGGPIHLTIKLPGGRAVAGDFIMARLVGEEGKIASVTLDSEPVPWQAAYSVALGHLESLRASTEEIEKLHEWRDQVEAGETSGVTIYLESTDLPEACVDISGFLDSPGADLWMVGTVLTWDRWLLE